MKQKPERSFITKAVESLSFRKALQTDKQTYQYQISFATNRILNCKYLRCECLMYIDRYHAFSEGYNHKLYLFFSFIFFLVSYKRFYHPLGRFRLKNHTRYLVGFLRNEARLFFQPWVVPSQGK